MQMDLSLVTKEYIEEEYLQKGRSLTSIAKQHRIGKVKFLNYVKSLGIKVKPSNEPEDLIGKTFNHLTVKGKVEDKNKRKGYKTQWKCECDCSDHNIIILPTSRLKTQISCGCKASNKTKGPERKTWKGCGKISGNYFGIIKRQAQNRNIEFNITIDYIWALFLKQNGRCALTSQELCFADTNTRDKYGDRTASLDRINPEKGYVIGNVWWTHKDVNRMRWILEVQEFVNICDMVSQNKHITNCLMLELTNDMVENAA